jgi:uncharacterized delta-60 repeat protein
MGRTSSRRNFSRPSRCLAPVIQSLEHRRLFSAGALDTGFDVDGKVITPMGNTFELAQAQAVQSDGKILVAGSTGGNVGIVRYNANGSRDTSFGADFDGRAIFDLGSSSDAAYGIAVDGSGRIYVSGVAGATGFVLRLNSNGSLDSGFSGDGEAFVPGAFFTGVAVQGTKVLVCGNSGSSFDFAIFRFTSGGSLDGTFGGGDGVATRNFTASGFEFPSAVAVAPNGNIVAAGTVDTTEDGFGYDVAVYITNSSGGFVGSHTVDASGSGKTDFGSALKIGPSNSIYVAGQSFVATGQSNFSVTKFNSLGSPLTSFGGGDGVVQVSFTSGDDEGAHAIDLQSDSKIVIAGDDGAGHMAVARLTGGGSLDTTFDGDGKKTIDMGNTLARAVGAKVLSSGDIQLGGIGGTTNGGVDFAAVRLNSNGSLDNGFNGNGKAFTDFDTADDFASDVYVGSDNKAIVVGTRLATGVAPFGQGDFAVARYNSNGSLDTSFSGDGRLLTDFGGDDRATAVVKQSDGKIVVAGFTNPGPGVAVKFAVARYNANGSLDTSFSGDGKQTISFGSNDAYAWDMKLQGDGKIVIVGGVGNTDGTSTGNFAIVRLNTNGSLDTSFSGDGKQTVNFGTNPAAVARGVSLQSNGKIVVAGLAGIQGGLARLNTNGSLDTSFSGDGKLMQNLGSDFPDYFFAVDIQSDGKIVAGGSTGNQMAVARYNANGSLDGSFDGDGIKLGAAGRILDLKIQSTGKIVAAGSNQAGGGSQFRVVRFNSNGSADSSWAGDGVADTHFNANEPTAANALFFAPGGKVVVAGYTTSSFDNQDFAIARYSLT